MPRQPREKGESGYYHVMVRGNEQRKIFKEDEDRSRFIEILKIKKKDNKFFLHAFCLMDNHVHLMISEGEEDLAQVMKRITVSYVNYFNKKYKRVGHLFQGRYKSETVEDERYFITLARYIHQNPVKAGMVKSAGDYKWSSYNYYFNPNEDLVDTQVVLSIFSDNEQTAKKLFEEYMNEESSDKFIDVEDDLKVMDEVKAKKLFARMLEQEENKISDDLIREFRNKTNLPLRKIADITGYNKDKINRIVNTVK